MPSWVGMASEARQKPVRRAMATYSVEELEMMAAELNAHLATAKDMAEQEEAARTLISAPKKVITSARARGGEQQDFSKQRDRQDAAVDRPRRRPQVGRPSGPPALLQRAGLLQVDG